MNIALILAGGSGTRMGNVEKPKQFLKLGQKPILVHTIEAFLLNGNIDHVIVLVPDLWVQYTEDLIKNNNLLSDRLHVHEGGASRNETIISGCDFINKKLGIEDCVLVTHDSVRPFITQRIINDNISSAKSGVAVDTVIPAFDTIVRSVDGETIQDIPVRSELYLGQTPQSFKLSDFKEITSKLSHQELETFSDACGLFIKNNKQVKLVNGEQYNMKITTQHDLDLANSILRINNND